MKIDVGSSVAGFGFQTVDASDLADYQVDLDTSHIPLPDGSVDVINCSHLLEHLNYPNVHATIAEFHRLLRPTGFISIVVPNTDSNSFWKGFLPHLDMRMNKYIMRGLSTQEHAVTSEENQFMMDYNGYSYGLSQSYYKAPFDFRVLMIRSFHLYRFCLLPEALRNEVERLYNNTVDQHRIFATRMDSSRDPATFDYDTFLLELPDNEVMREIDQAVLRQRRFVDMSLEVINMDGVLRDWGFAKAVLYFEYVHFAKNHVAVLASLETDLKWARSLVARAKQQPDRNAQLFDSKLSYLEESMERAKELSRVMSESQDGIDHNMRPF